MGIFSWILLGLIAGALAKFIMPGKDPGGIIVTIETTLSLDLQTRQACLLGFIIFNPVTRQISDLLDDPLAFFLGHTFE
jgi:hypothetical protein